MHITRANSPTHQHALNTVVYVTVASKHIMYHTKINCKPIQDHYMIADPIAARGSSTILVWHRQQIT